MKRDFCLLVSIILAYAIAGCYCCDRREKTETNHDFFGRETDPPSIESDESDTEGN